MLEKAAALKRFESSLLGKELKKQTSVAEKQYQKSGNAFVSNKKEEDKTKKKQSRTKSNLVYDNYFTFYKYRNTKEFTKRSLDSKLNDLNESTLQNKLQLFYYDNTEIKPNNKDHIKDLGKREVLFDTALELYNKFLNIYKTQHGKLTKARKKKTKVQDIPENIPIDLYLDEDDLPPMPVLESDEKEAKLEPEETIAERVKMILKKEKQ